MSPDPNTRCEPHNWRPPEPQTTYLLAAGAAVAIALVTGGLAVGFFGDQLSRLSALASVVLLVLGAALRHPTARAWMVGLGVLAFALAVASGAYLRAQ